MTPKRFAIFLAVNVVVSIAVTLAVLLAWQYLQSGQGAASLPGPAGPGAPPSTKVVMGTVPPPPPSPIAAPTPVTYVVQRDDTLSSIATRYNVSVEDIMAANGLSDPNSLAVGQVLIIPVGGLPTATPVTPTATVPATPPTPIATTTAPAGGTPLLKIAGVLSPGDLAGEAVLITNDGAPVRLDGWTLSDAQGNAFTFPSLTLWTGGAVTVHTGTGEDKPTDLYWNRSAAAWPSGAVVTLKDPGGVPQASYTVP